LRKLMLLAAMLAMVLAAAAPALAQDDGGDDQYNLAGVNCTQILQQVGGDQYATATGSGEGDTATDDGTADGGDDTADDGDDAADDGAAVAEENQEEAGDVAAVNNQEFTAEQIQYCLSIAGNNNAVDQNTGVVGTDDDGDGAVDEEDGSEAVNDAVAEVGVVGVDDDSDGAVDEEDGSEVVAIVEGADTGDAEGIAVLPDTGGYSLVALGAGVLLVAGGLAARRFVR
jgi:hypothetical protein